ncbi:MAG TPA: phosphatase [Candidatus Didemnitutus sp.]|nr:phosphatase [Candidatus Didemnitutus sp.]
MPGPCVAVLDIGSNSIKILVAARANDGWIAPLFSKTIEARISAGISAAEPRLSEDGMQRGLAAIQDLLVAATPQAPSRVLLVATSAVRDAANGPEFRERVRAATGCEIRILTGEEEANGIGRGLTCDPALADLQNFYVFDLGGGSLECLAFKARQVQQAISLQLGAVRLTERFAKDTTTPFSAKSATRVMAHTRTEIAVSGFRFDLVDPTAVITGGTVSTVRSILGARSGQKAEQTSPRISIAQLRDILETVGAMPLDQRKQVPGLPPERADIFPTALATIIAVAETGNLTGFRHSFYNLRYGLAAELLASL